MDSLCWNNVETRRQEKYFRGMLVSRFERAFQLNRILSFDLKIIESNLLSNFIQSNLFKNVHHNVCHSVKN